MILDCARILPLEEATVIGDHALRKGAGGESRRRLLGESQTKLGSRRALDLLDVLDGRSESAGETRTRLLLHAFGLHNFTPQVENPTREGLFRADFADPEARIIIEFDGAAKYTDYRPAEDVLIAERRRENALQEFGMGVLPNQLGAPGPAGGAAPKAVRVSGAAPRNAKAALARMTVAGPQRSCGQGPL